MNPPDMNATEYQSWLEHLSMTEVRDYRLETRLDMELEEILHNKSLEE